MIELNAKQDDEHTKQIGEKEPDKLRDADMLA
jgi:hypothetical protein